MSKFIGVGACGNKSVVQLIKDEVVETKECLLLNTTQRDVPVDYRDLFVKFGNTRGGCGKDTNLAYNSLYDSIEAGKLKVLDEILGPKDEVIYIATSLRGGTGCGAAICLAEYYLDVYEGNVKVTIMAFDGFDDDVRGMKNAIEFFKKLPKGVTIQIISNKKFLQEANNDKIAAENLANEEFSARMKCMLGQTITDGWKNIDDADLFKATTTPGYMTVEHGKLPTNLKNVDAYNKEVSSIIVNSKSLDVLQPGAQRMAIILTTNDQIKGNVDQFHTVIREKFGTSGELFEHFQSNSEPSITIMSSGMRMPLEEVKLTLKKYEEEVAKIRTKDNFFDELSGISTTAFDMFDETAASSLQRNEIIDVKDRRQSFLNKRKSSMEGNVVIAQTPINKDSK